MEKSLRSNTEISVECNSIQLPNFFVQFGTPPNGLEEIIKSTSPGFYQEVVVDNEVFGRIKGDN